MASRFPRRPLRRVSSPGDFNSSRQRHQQPPREARSKRQGITDQAIHRGPEPLLERISPRTGFASPSTSCGQRGIEYHRVFGCETRHDPISHRLDNFELVIVDVLAKPLETRHDQGHLAEAERIQDRARAGVNDRDVRLAKPSEQLRPRDLRGTDQRRRQRADAMLDPHDLARMSPRTERQSINESGEGPPCADDGDHSAQNGAPACSAPSRRATSGQRAKR